MGFENIKILIIVLRRGKHNDLGELSAFSGQWSAKRKQKIPSTDEVDGMDKVGVSPNDLGY
jgi:hypothetical protein